MYIARYSDIHVPKCVNAAAEMDVVRSFLVPGGPRDAEIRGDVDLQTGARSNVFTYIYIVYNELQIYVDLHNLLTGS